MYCSSNPFSISPLTGRTRVKTLRDEPGTEGVVEGTRVDREKSRLGREVVCLVPYGWEGRQREKSEKGQRRKRNSSFLPLTWMYGSNRVSIGLCVVGCDP